MEWRYTVSPCCIRPSHTLTISHITEKRATKNRTATQMLHQREKPPRSAAVGRGGSRTQQPVVGSGRASGDSGGRDDPDDTGAASKSVRGLSCARIVELFSPWRDNSNLSAYPSQSMRWCRRRSICRLCAQTSGIEVALDLAEHVRPSLPMPTSFTRYS